MNYILYVMSCHAMVISCHGSVISFPATSPPAHSASYYTITAWVRQEHNHCHISWRWTGGPTFCIFRSPPVAWDNVLWTPRIKWKYLENSLKHFVCLISDIDKCSNSFSCLTCCHLVPSVTPAKPVLSFLWQPGLTANRHQNTNFAIPAQISQIVTWLHFTSVET